MKHPEGTDKLTVSARGPFNVYYEGNATAVTAINRVGEFDVLPGHADFFSVLSPGKVIIETSTDADPVEFKITNGIITVRDNEVLLFVNI